MMATEVINRMQNIVDKHGDLEVVTDENLVRYPIEEVCVVEDGKLLIS